LVLMKEQSRDNAENAAVGIICKTPSPGNSKTRMIHLVGTQGAADLAGVFLRDVAAAINTIDPGLRCQGYAVFSPEGSEDRLRSFLPVGFGLLCRRDATLGVVLSSAAQYFLSAGHDCVVLVNADSPTLPPTLIPEAVAALREPGDRVVLGPAADGGYYLIGVKQAHPELFDDIPWSTADVFNVTVKRAANIGLPVSTLATWYDVDDLETIVMLLAEMRGEALDFGGVSLRGGDAQFTRAFVDAHPEFAKTIAVRLKAQEQAQT
jgi:uncharacterized protein